MDLANIPANQLNELERLAKELLVVIRKSKLENETLVESLRQLEIQAGEIRRSRFDDANPEYAAY